MRAALLISALGLTVLVLAGCDTDQAAQPTVALATPPTWGPEPRTASRAVADDPDSQWWRSFQDAELVSLVDRLAAQNLDLKTAAERVVQAGAQRRVVASQGLPRVEGQSVDLYNRASETSLPKLFQLAPGAPTEFALFQEGLQSSWELDLFGRVRRAVEAQDARVLAAVENRSGIALAASAELAQSYLTLRGTQARLAIAARNLALADENIRLVQSRFANGVATTLDLAQARSQQATIAQTLPPLRTQEAQLINAIGYLLGEVPRALDTELRPAKALPRVPTRVPVGLPVTLVRRRPDVREAEARLHAAVAETGVAVADFYPDVTLIGNVNVQSISLSNLFTLPSRSFNIGPNISIPIFEGGRLRGQLALRQSEQREAAIAFQRTVLQAWREVDDALTAYAEAQRRRAAVARAVAQNEIALRAARQRYTQGLVDFLNVNTTQAQLLQSQNDLADSDTQITTNLVTLYRALGGGWPTLDPPPGRMVARGSSDDGSSPPRAGP